MSDATQLSEPATGMTGDVVDADALDNMKAGDSDLSSQDLKLADMFDTQIGQMIRVFKVSITELQAAAKQLAASAEETSAQSAAVAAAAEQATAGVETVASSAEEMSSTISEVAQQAADANSRANRGVESAHAVEKEISDLLESVETIDDVVDAISNISEQTNLLALNATIEAARAGDAGRGFAVVAAEVKKLAGETHKLTEQVNQRLETIKESCRKSVKSVKGVARDVESIDEATTQIATAVEEQSAATGEISRSAQEAAAGTQEVSKNISGVQTAASESAEATTVVHSNAGRLLGQAEELDKAVDVFLDKLKN